MKFKLKQLANVQAGYSFRSRIEADNAGSIRVIQMKDLLANNTVSCEKLLKIDKSDIKPNHFVQQGDLVFRSRGSLPSAAILLEQTEKTVVAGPLLRIRVTKPEKILPAYLNWYISQKEAENFLKSRADGTAQMTISKEVLEELEVPVPELNIQKVVIELANLSAHEQHLLQKLAKKREQLISIKLKQLVAS